MVESGSRGVLDCALIFREETCLDTPGVLPPDFPCWAGNLREEMGDLSCFLCKNANKGDHEMPLHNMPLCHKERLEVDTMEKQQTSEELFALPLSSQK